jgi:hypothetical protein
MRFNDACEPPMKEPMFMTPVRGMRRWKGKGDVRQESAGERGKEGDGRGG